MSIGAVKGVEFGEGFRVATMRGSEHNDVFVWDEEKQCVRPLTNRAGGVLGGITTGEDLVMRIAVKPPSSIQKIQQTVNREGKSVSFRVGGRHDPCICPRVVPVAEAMVALVLIDHLLMQERLTRTNELQELRDKIDTIDTQLLLMLAQRQRLVKEIAAVKQKQNLSIHDEQRERHLVQQWLEFGEKLGFSRDFIEQMVQLLLQYSRQWQQDVASGGNSEQ